ncbi:hypothetical protein [Anabaena sp. UHCC 0451]|uniref:hypothetical protein n=1 Tax=Anabaena sp. UHCC 0451 TaxID=2055235 RepID=UPI002B214874|nr:hypothetical protein [Anabaena sp. UHCC 0451]MEA5578647.1 hypothetical protein [Anabaena sp. UHCC 0451]
MPMLKMNCQLSLHLILLSINQRNNSIEFDNIPDAEKFNFIQNAVLKLSIDDKAKLVKYLLGNEELQVIAKPSQLNAANILSANIHQISLMDKAEMGVILAAIVQRLKNS